MFRSFIVLVGAHGKLVTDPKFEPRSAQLVMLSDDLATRSHIFLIYWTLNSPGVLLQTGDVSGGCEHHVSQATCQAPWSDKQEWT